MANNSKDNENPNALSLPLILEMLSRFRWRFILVSYLVAMLVLCLYLTHPLTYRGSALIERRSEQFDVIVVDRDNLQIALWRAEISQSMKDSEIYKKVIKRIRDKVDSGEYDSFPVTNQRAIGMMNSASIKVKPSKALDSITISITSQEPVATRMIINEWSQVFTEEAMKQVTNVIQEREQFYNDQFRNKQQELSLARLDFSQFSVANSEVLPSNLSNTHQRKEAVSQEIEQLEQLIGANEQSIARFQSEITTNREPRVERVTESVPNPEYAELRKQVRDLQWKIEEFRQVSNATDKHPTVLAMKRNVEQFEKALESTPQLIHSEKVTVIPSDVPKLKIELESLVMRNGQAKVKLSQLNKEIAKIEQILKKAPTVAGEYQVHESKIAQLQVELRELSETLSKVRQAGTDETGRKTYEIYVARPCGNIKQAINPTFRNVVLVAGGLAIGLGGLVVFISHKATNSISSVEDAKKQLPLPILGVIEDIRSETEVRWDRVRRMIFMPTLSILMLSTLVALAGLNFMIINGDATLESTGQYVQQVFVSFIR